MKKLIVYFLAGTFLISQENTAADVENDSETSILLGFHFPIYEYMDLAPVIKYNIIESEDDPSIDFGLNFQFNF